MCCPIGFVKSGCLKLLVFVSFVVSFNLQAALPPVPDPALQQCISDASLANNWSLVEDVTVLDCSNRNINDIFGLDQFTSLQSLNLANNKLQDISALTPLFALPSNQQLLTRIDIQNNRITDISALNSAAQLLQLDISDNQDIAFSDVYLILQNNINLMHLGLAGVRDVFDLFVIQNLQNLQTLNVRNTNLIYLNGVERLVNLSSLDASQNNIVDISVLDVLVTAPADLQVLTQLSLSENKINDIAVLETAAKLTRLDLSDNTGLMFNDVQFIIQNNPNLTHLGLAGVQGFTDLFALNNLNALQELNMQNTGLTSINGVELFSDLEVLDISHNKISDVFNLNGFFNVPVELQTLKQLKLNDNAISDVGALNGATQLVVLDISGNRNLSFDAIRLLLQDNPQLIHLGIGDVQGLGQLFELSNLTNLQVLNVSNTGLFDIAGIEVFTKLESLDVSRNNITDISPLSALFSLPAELQMLKHLDLSANRITDISALASVYGLIALDLSDNLNITLFDVEIILQNNPGIVNLGLAGVQWSFDLFSLTSLQNLQTLNMRNTGLVEVFGVEQLLSLRTLDLSQNNISDISTLSALFNLPIELQMLKHLDLSGNRITDINALVSVYGLISLNLSDNLNIALNDVTIVLQNNPDIVNLGLAGVQGFYDLFPFASLQNLQTLNMRNTGLVEVFGAEQLNGLQILDVSQNNITDISLLSTLFNQPAELQTLKQLKLNDNAISDVGALNGATQLVVLDISGNRNLSFDAIRLLLQDNPQLIHLGIGDVQGLGQLFELSNLTNLQVLNLSNTGLFDIAGIEVFTKLESLDVSRNNITDISPLSALFSLPVELQMLKHLDLSDNRITDVNALVSAYGLISLDLSDNINIVRNDVEIILQNNPDIVNLGLAGVQWSFDLFSLMPLQNLQTLNMRNTGLFGVFGVDQLGGLQALDLSQNNITDISPLSALFNPPAEFQMLKHLDLSDNEISDVSALLSASQLISLNLSDNINIVQIDVVNVLNSNPGIVDLGLAGIQGFNDLFPFTSLQNLQALNMRNTGLVEVFGVEQLLSLRTLNLSQNNITNISPLNTLFSLPAELQMLKHLDLSDNRITDVSALISVYGLMSLNLSDNLNIAQFDVVNVLSSNPGIVDLGLAGVQGFDDLLSVGVLTNLKTLNMRNTGLSSLMGIESLINLESLDISDNVLVDLDPMGVLFNAPTDQQKLKYLNFSNNNVGDLFALNQSSTLKFVDATLNSQIGKAEVEFLYFNNPGITVLVTDYDLNADGVVTGLDYSLFRAMQASNDPSADFDADGVVTAADYMLLRNNM